MTLQEKLKDLLYFEPNEITSLTQILKIKVIYNKDFVPNKLYTEIQTKTDSPIRWGTVSSLEGNVFQELTDYDFTRIKKGT